MAINVTTVVLVLFLIITHQRTENILLVEIILTQFLKWFYPLLNLAIIEVQSIIIVCHRMT